MLFPYQYVPHQMEKMQAYIDFIFFEVWCKAPAGAPFSADLFESHPELYGIMAEFQWGDTAGGDFFYSQVERIYGYFASLAPQKITQLQQWYLANNDIEKACANDPTISLARYSDISALHLELSKQFAVFFKGLYAQNLLGLAVLKDKIGDIDNHYKTFMDVNALGKCPFCGISDMQGVYHSKREAYDHYFPKGLYPFNSINFRNLVPACHHCNSSYKTSKDPAAPLKDPAGAIQRRKVFYPYANTCYNIEVTIELGKLDVDRLVPDDIRLSFGPPELKEEIETWRDVYGIEERYKAKCCGVDAKDWLEQIRILRDAHGIAPEASLKTLHKQAGADPFANSNFLKKAFLDGCQRGGLFNAAAEGA